MTVAITAANLASLPLIRHGFFTRQGGVSGGIYASLNCGYGSNDDPEHVSENRRRIASSLGGRNDGIVTLYQEHGTTALEISAPVDRHALPRADAVVTRTPGLVIGVLTADCAPVLLADAEAGIVAAAHAGWRGAVTGVIESVVARMETLGANRSRIAGAVGPCINQDAYEVGPEFEAEFLARDSATARFFQRSKQTGRPHFDLPAFVLQRLADARVTNVEDKSACTLRDESLFFSFRRKTQRKEPDYGRQMSAIVVA